MNLELNDLRNCYWAGSTTDGGVTWTTDLSAVVPGSLNSCSLFVDYIYLDTDERRRFAQVSHEYLIEQLQFTGDESTSNTNNKIKLNFKMELKSSECVKTGMITQENSLVDPKVKSTATSGAIISVARYPNCGDSLRAFIATSDRKLYEGPRLIAESKGKRMNDWEIRSIAAIKMQNVQRLNGCR